MSCREYSNKKRLIPVGYLYKEGRTWKVSKTGSTISSYIQGLQDPTQVTSYLRIEDGEEKETVVSKIPSNGQIPPRTPNTIEFPVQINI